MPTTVNDYLKYLSMAGWSELIAPRWRRQIELDLLDCFGDDLSEEVLQQVVAAVLYPNTELSEDEYEYLSPIPKAVCEK